MHKALPYHDGSFEDWAAEESDTHPFRYDEGVHIWVADVDYDPDGTWLSGRSLVDGEEDDGGEQ